MNELKKKFHSIICIVKKYSEYISRKMLLKNEKEEKAFDKIKVTKADIVVHGTAEKPYYVIVYHEVGKDYENEGFGSYYLDNVFAWKDEYFEFAN